MIGGGGARGRTGGRSRGTARERARWCVGWGCPGPREPGGSQREDPRPAAALAVSSPRSSPLHPRRGPQGLEALARAVHPAGPCATSLQEKAKRRNWLAALRRFAGRSNPSLPRADLEFTRERCGSSKSSCLVLARTSAQAERRSGGRCPAAALRLPLGRVRTTVGRNAQAKPAERPEVQANLALAP